MKWPEIQAPDCHSVDAAKGWLDLGVPQEAQAELDRLSFGLQNHPDVLVIRWKISARMLRWDQALELARSMVSNAPDWPAGHICLAHSLYNSQRAQEALTELRSAANRFPRTGPIFYLLARLAGHVGAEAEAKLWLGRWKDMADAGAAKNTVNQDPDPSPIWSDLGVCLSKPLAPPGSPEDPGITGIFANNRC